MSATHHALWGELRSVLARERFDVVENLWPVLRRWPESSPDEQLVLLNYLRPHAHHWRRDIHDPPLLDLLNLWSHGEAQVLWRALTTTPEPLILPDVRDAMRILLTWRQEYERAFLALHTGALSHAEIRQSRTLLSVHGVAESGTPDLYDEEDWLEDIFANPNTSAHVEFESIRPWMNLPALEHVSVEFLDDGLGFDFGRGPMWDVMGVMLFLETYGQLVTWNSQSPPTVQPPLSLEYNAPMARFWSWYVMCRGVRTA